MHRVKQIEKPFKERSSPLRSFPVIQMQDGDPREQDAAAGKDSVDRTVQKSSRSSPRIEIHQREHPCSDQEGFLCLPLISSARREQHGKCRRQDRPV